MLRLTVHQLQGKTKPVFWRLQKHYAAIQILPSSYQYSSDSSYQFLQRSKVPSDHFQKSLPRLPIPELPKTCERYLKSQQPILNNEEYSKTEKLVKDFENGVGKDLHEELKTLDKQNKQTSYISGPWYDMYLKDRRAVMLNHNPFMAMKLDERPAYNQPAIRLSNFLVSSIRFAKSLRDNVLEPEVFHLNPEKSDTSQFRNFVRLLPKAVSWYGAYWYKAFPLDMSQFPRLFNSTRIPKPERDELFTDPTAKHIVIFRRGHPYIFDVLDKDGNIKPANEILALVQGVLSDEVEQAEHPIGILTTQDRDTWTSYREQLEQAGNSETLKKIDSAFYAIALDDSFVTDDATTFSRQFLHGDNLGNRWFDKSFSLIMLANGMTSLNFEHAWGDGVAVLRFFNEVYKETTENPFVHPDSRPAPIDVEQDVQRLEFNLTDEIKAGIGKAKEKFDSAVEGLELHYIQYPRLGKNFIKKQKLSPDSFMQLAIQLAYFKQYGGTVATYESCSTSAFRHGRTETVRSCTSATKHACDLFSKPGTSKDELRKAMVECSNVHGQLTKEAAMGQGFDRHLFAMRTLAEKRGEAMPDLYLDPAYKSLNHIILSTSTLSSPAIFIGGFAPVVPDGYGVGYGIDDDQLGFVVTAYPPNRDAKAFLRCMEQSLDEMHDVLA